MKKAGEGKQNFTNLSIEQIARTLNTLCSFVHTYTSVQEPFPNITSLDATTRRYLRVCAELSCLKKTHACISLSQQSCCSSKKRKKNFDLKINILFIPALLCEHRGARNLHSSPLFMHCCVMLRPN